MQNTEKDELFEAQFTINFIVFENPSNNYIIAKARDLKTDAEIKDNKTQFTVKGVFPRIDSGSTFKGNCKWTFDSKYGYALETFCPVLVLPSNIFGIKHFLMRNVKGVGEKTVDKIINAYGEASLDRIRQGGLDGIKGIPEKTKKRIYKKVMESQTLEDLSVYLFQHGVTNYNDVVEIYNEFEDEALDMIQANPYSICKNSVSRFPLADRIALSSGFEADSPERKQRVILYYIHDNMFQSGNLFEKETDICNNLYRFMTSKGLAPFNYNKDTLAVEIDALSKSGQITIDYFREGTERLLYLPWVYKKEEDTAEMINKMLLNNIDSEVFDISDFLKIYEKETGIQLDPVQKKGVENAFNHKFSILTGGPGTGKTLTINAIIECIKYFRPKAEITLCAPTGRAAKRMSEMTSLPSYTIHRLLGLKANWETRNEDIELDTDYVIVDESSMIDHSLFHILLKAVFESDAALILVGDKDQLPPVGAGLPFRDLIESGAVPVVKLENLYRQAGESQINTNAKAILKGITDIGEKGLQFDLNKQDFFFFPSYTPEQIIENMIKTVDALAKRGVDSDNITILSPMKKTDIGVINLNNVFQNHLNPPSESKAEIKLGSTLFRLGDRVMQTKNNYDLNVFNGDIGRITEINEEDEKLTVSFDDFKIENGKLTPEARLITYEFRMINELMLAYATTVHKSQGSEYPIVIMPLSPLLVNLSRSILYTAVSRSKEKFIFIGDTESLRRGILKMEETKRNTRLRERLLLI